MVINTLGAAAHGAPSAAATWAKPPPTTTRLRDPIYLANHYCPPSPRQKDVVMKIGARLRATAQPTRSPDIT